MKPFEPLNIITDVLVQGFRCLKLNQIVNFSNGYSSSSEKKTTFCKLISQYEEGK
ncbi:hypothetical protein [Clostridium estertheticum]|uniref:hypothetical protein n=1 Tax=Clostridium estertheticum TaxID=238834 RepID=UPI001CF32DA6|nr:hypothetical protein [Clostridium estertheticum]MCB2307259.1 hypothetical protein [Clostridium estertheticum]MCB2344908.1 hypothetical protein [Clostridium estertheticum]